MRGRILLVVLSTLSMPVCAIAQEHSHTTAQPDNLKWSAPAVYNPGAQLAVVKGDPSKEGMYVVRLKVPAGFKIAPHSHPNDENVTVLSGSFNIGTGDKVDGAARRHLCEPRRRSAQEVADPFTLNTIV